ncbi:MAG: hypothetical protein HY303_18505 [Candidatus Wallbacteria bacterium]|nr:hypothetical protein [Candidatus Wallbacteria bacterium]
MNSLQTLRPLATLVMVLALTGCGGGGNGQQPAAPQAPVNTTVQTPSTGPSAPSTATTTSKASTSTASGTAIATTPPGEKSVPLNPTDSTGNAVKDINQMVGAGLVANLGDAAVNQFRLTVWKNIGQRYGKQANFWALDAKTDADQAQFLQWRGVNPTVMVTKGKVVVERLENPTEAQIGAALERYLPKTSS